MTKEETIKYKDFVNDFILIQSKEHDTQCSGENSSGFIVFEVSGEKRENEERGEIKKSFDKYGRIKEIRYYKSNKLISTNRSKYDDNGNEIEHAYIQKNNPELNRKTRSFYNEQNTCIKKELYDTKNFITEIVTYKYDDQKNCIEITCRKSTGKLKYRFCFEFTKENKKTKEFCYKGNGHLAWDTNYTYNSKGLLVEKAYMKKRSLFYKIVYTYYVDGSKLSTKKYLHKDYLEKWDGKINAGFLDFMLWTEND